MKEKAKKKIDEMLRLACCGFFTSNIPAGSLIYIPLSHDMYRKVSIPVQFFWGYFESGQFFKEDGVKLW